MYETAKKSRAANKAKAERLANRPIERVDSSDWTPPPLLNADVKTGMRPVSKQALKRGGKVHGEKAKVRADRMARKAGGRVETKGEQPLVDRYVNRDLKKANDYRDGEKHEGALKRGGRAHKDGGGAMGSFKDTKTGKQITPAEVATSGFRDKSGNIPLPPRRDEAEKKGLKKGGEVKEKWIQKAIKKPGALHKQLGVPEGKKIPEKKLSAAAEKGGKLGKRARLAKTLRAMHKDGGKVHSDAAEDKAMIKSMVKPSALKDKACYGGRMKKADGGPMMPPNQDPRLSIVKPKAMEFGANMVTPGLKKGGRAGKAFGGPMMGGAMPTAMGAGVAPTGAMPTAAAPMAGAGTAPTMPTLPAQAMANAQGRPFQGGQFMPPGLQNMQQRMGDMRQQWQDRMQASEQEARDRFQQAMQNRPNWQNMPSWLTAGGTNPGGQTMPSQLFGGANSSTPMPPVSAGAPVAPLARAHGGRTKGKGKTNINIVIAQAPKGQQDQGAMPPMPPAGGAGLAQMPPMMPPAPPAGAPPAMAGKPPMPFKKGGRVSKVAHSYKDMTAGAGSGEGRLQKTDIAERMPKKTGGKVYRSYKDMDAGAGSGFGRLEKTEIESKKSRKG